MKKVFTTMLRSLAFTALCSGAAYAQTSYQLVWADEFETKIGPDWKFETGNNNGWGNNEKQYYQAGNANTAVVNGELLITAKKETMGGLPYTSARMKTQGLKEFTFGKIEARMKLPLGQGLWPAFWMLGGNITSVSWPRCGELDIMEQVNAISEVHGTVHWHSPTVPGDGHAQYSGETTVAPNAYHVYGVEWDATAIRWFVDGVQFHVINIANGTGSTEEFQKPFFILLNLAVAGIWPGQVVDQSKLPATMYVDYVRVYQKVTATATTKSTGENDGKAAIQIYPNPVTDQLTVGSDVSLTGHSYWIVNALGQHVASGSVERNNTVNVAALRTGIYTLMVTAQDQQILARRFSKQ